MQVGLKFRVLPNEVGIIGMQSAVVITEYVLQYIQSVHCRNLRKKEAIKHCPKATRILIP